MILDGGPRGAQGARKPRASGDDPRLPPEQTNIAG